MFSLPVSVFALGLGEIEVSSALNQPLDATVDIVAFRPDEIEKLIVSLADLQTFNRAGLERPILLTKLRFKTIERDDGTYYIQITSHRPVREPFITFLVEADWAKGRIIREFTILLDPPILLARKKSGASKPKATPVDQVAESATSYSDDSDYEQPTTTADNFRSSSDDLTHGERQSSR